MPGLPWQPHALRRAHEWARASGVLSEVFRPGALFATRRVSRASFPCAARPVPAVTGLVHSALFSLW